MSLEYKNLFVENCFTCKWWLIWACFSPDSDEMTFTQERAIKRESSINLASLQLKHLNDMFLQTHSFSLQGFSLDGLELSGLLWWFIQLFGLFCGLLWCCLDCFVYCVIMWLPSVTNILQNIIFCVQQKENVYIFGWTVFLSADWLIHKKKFN